MKHTIWSTIEVFLRLPQVPAYVPGRENRTTGKTNYSTRLKVRQAWLDEIRITQQAARIAGLAASRQIRGRRQ